MPGECSTDDSLIDASKIIGYDQEELKSIPEDAILGVGCGAPIKFANLKDGETVVDLGSGAGIDAFLSANKVSKSDKVIGINMTDEMLDKARKNAKEGNYTNVEFRKGDIENNIPVDQSSMSYGVVITDFMMPRMNGIDLLEKIRVAYPWIKVVLVTGCREEAITSRARQLGAFAVLRKPCSFQQLHGTIRCALLQSPMTERDNVDDGAENDGDQSELD